MKKTLLTVLLSLASLFATAQSIESDTINPQRVVTSCTSHGLSLLNNLDTYLSGYNFTGIGHAYTNEKFRRARTGKYIWRYQILTGVTTGTTFQNGNTMLSVMASRYWSGYHHFAPCERLQLLAGAQVQLSGGVLYNPANGNNPAAAKVRAALAATGMAIYKFNIKQSKYTLRYQIDVPLIGVMFSPEYGESYYEMFGCGTFSGKNIKLATPVNCPSSRHTLSLDIPFWFKKRNTLRISYIADIFQSNVNGIKTHIYDHSFNIGFVRTLYKVKNTDALKAYSPY